MATTEVLERPGLTLVGEFLSAAQEADSTDSAGKVWPGKFRVKVLVGDRVFSVEYRDEGSAADALVGQGADGAPVRGDSVALAVGVRSAKGYTFYYGRRE